jgi:hypothetical protein
MAASKAKKVAVKEATKKPRRRALAKAVNLDDTLIAPAVEKAVTGLAAASTRSNDEGRKPDLWRPAPAMPRATGDERLWGRVNVPVPTAQHEPSIGGELWLALVHSTNAAELIGRALWRWADAHIGTWRAS